MDAAAARAMISTVADLERDGIPIRHVRKAVAAGEVIAVHPGRFVETAMWDAAFEEDRHLLRVVGAASAARGGTAVVSHVSAAVLHGLPLFRHQAGRPHISGDHTDGLVSSHAPVRHHNVVVPDRDRVLVDGIVCTSLERTVYDVIRTVGREAAVACADSALRQVAWRESERRYDDEEAKRWRMSLIGRIMRSTGARGIRQARWVAAFADGRAQLPGESVSRLYLDDLGFAPPRLQVPFPGPRGEEYLIDFGLDDMGVWGEFDGVGKYFDPAWGGDGVRTRGAPAREGARRLDSRAKRTCSRALGDAPRHLSRDPRPTPRAFPSRAAALTSTERPRNHPLRARPPSLCAPSRWLRAR